MPHLEFGYIDLAGVAKRTKTRHPAGTNSLVLETYQCMLVQNQNQEQDHTIAGPGNASDGTSNRKLPRSPFFHQSEQRRSYKLHGGRLPGGERHLL